MIFLIKELKADRWKYIITAVILLFLAITIVWQYPFVKNMLKQGTMEGMPDWLASQAEAQTEFPYYLSANWFDKNLIQITVILSILLGMSVFAKEIEDHTIEFLLARPLSRQKLFLMKTTIQLVIIFGYVFISSAVMGLTGYFLGYEINFIRLIIGSLPVLIKCYIIYSLTLYFSLMLDDQIKSGLLTFVLIIAMIGLSFMDIPVKLNIFSYARATNYYVFGDFPLGESLILLGIAGVLYFLAYNKFLRRDF
ncbi:MAG: ABC transporter permease subunit [Bacillota bacterium]